MDMRRGRINSQIFPKLALVAFTLTILSLVGCGGGGGDASSHPVTQPTVKTPLAVVSSTPVSGAAGVAFNSSIAVTFNADINPATLTASTFEVGSLSGTVAYDATNKTAVFHPSAAMAPNTTYNVVVTTGVKSATGATLAQDNTFSFSTGNAPDLTPPTVISVVPFDGATNVPLDTKVTATFSEAMDSTGLVGITANGVTASLEYNSQTFTVTLTPASNLKPGTIYTGTLKGTVRDLAGNQIGADYIWTFTTAAQ